MQGLVQDQVAEIPPRRITDLLPSDLHLGYASWCWFLQQTYRSTLKYNAKVKQGAELTDLPWARGCKQASKPHVADVRHVAECNSGSCLDAVIKWLVLQTYLG